MSMFLTLTVATVFCRDLNFQAEHSVHVCYSTVACESALSRDICDII